MNVYVADDLCEWIDFVWTRGRHVTRKGGKKKKERARWLGRILQGKSIYQDHDSGVLAALAALFYVEEKGAIKAKQPWETRLASEPRISRNRQDGK